VRAPGHAGDDGQATVELVLVLPLLALLALSLLQVALVVRDQVLVTEAARAAAREAAVSSDAGAARRAAARTAHLRGEHLAVEVGRRGHPGSRVRVVVRYAAPTEVPLIGTLLGPVHLRAEAAMRVET
jgi:Flp pilus assembly protein TadG